MMKMTKIPLGIRIPDRLREINESSFSKAVGYTSEEVEAMKDGEVIEFYEASDNGMTVGFAAVVPGNPGSYLLLLAVAGSIRGRGYGSEILGEVRRLYGSPILLDCEAHLVQFYERNGYSHSGYAMLYKGVRYEMMVQGEARLEDFNEAMERLGEVESDPTFLVCPDGSIREFRAYR